MREALLVLINSTYGADASVLVQISFESAQTTCMQHALLQISTPLQTPCNSLIVGRLASVAALVLALTIN